jgi:hypothetical protein
VPGGTATELKVAEVPAAVAAVQQALGGAQQYTEINVISSGVNMFVASSGQERAYFYTDGSLQPPGAPAATETTPFGLDGVDLTAPARLVPDAQHRFPGAVVETVALVRTSDLGLVWGLRTRSSRGGVLNVLYSPDGRLLAVSPA